MKKAIMIRHGQTDGPAGMKGRRDVPISVAGLKTMKMAGYLLDHSDNVPDLVVSGPLMRAVQSATALGLSEDQKARQIVMNEFDEVDVGDLEGKSGAIDLDEYDQNALANHAESTDKALARALDGLEQLKKMDFETAAVVSHSFLLILLYLHLPKAEGLPAMMPMLNGCGFEAELEPEVKITGLFPDGLLQELKKSGENWSR